MATIIPTLSPIIDELVRMTSPSSNGAVLLVDRIAILPHFTHQDSDEIEQAFRLWLSDGYRAIQAILKRELHAYLTTRHLVEGSYVLLTESEVAVVKRIGCDECLYVLLIDGLNVIGHDGRQSPIAQFRKSIGCVAQQLPHNRGREPPHPVTPSKRKYLPADSPGRLSKLLRRSAQGREDISPLRENRDGADELSLIPTSHSRVDLEDCKEPRSPQLPGRLKRKRSPLSSPLEAISDNCNMQLYKAHKRKTCDPFQVDSVLEKIQEKTITRPLNILPLAKIIGPRTIRNKIHDVLAIVCSVDDNVIRRRGMPDQRNLRITDHSTTKQVQLTVFVNAADFKPPVGTIALFRNLTTHEWNGGSLKAYQRDCTGVKWFFPNPVDVEQRKIELLKHSWDSRNERHPLVDSGVV